MNIQDLKSNTTWQEASNTINNNNNKISLAITTLENAKLKNKGYFTTLEKLNEAVPNPTIGSKAYVGTSEPYAIYIVENGAWVDSGYTGGDEIVAKITTDRIENGAVTTEKIATSAVTTEKIATSAVTTEKIATTAFDSTLSVSGKIAPADVVGGKITKLEGKLVDDKDITDLVNINGYIKTSDAKPTVSSNFSRTDYIRVIKESVIHYFGYGGNSGVAVVYGYDENKEPLRPLQVGEVGTTLDVNIVVPDDVKFVILSTANSTHDKYVQGTYFKIKSNKLDAINISITNIDNNVVELNSKTDTIASDLGNKLSFSNINKVLKSDGTFSSIDTFDCTDYVPSNKGDKVIVNGYSGPEVFYSTICGYDENKEFVKVLMLGFNLTTKYNQSVVIDDERIKYIVVGLANSNHENYKVREAIIIKTFALFLESSKKLDEVSNQVKELDHTINATDVLNLIPTDSRLDGNTVFHGSTYQQGWATFKDTVTVVNENDYAKVSCPTEQIWGGIRNDVIPQFTSENVEVSFELKNSVSEPLNIYFFWLDASKYKLNAVNNTWNKFSYILPTAEIKRLQFALKNVVGTFYVRNFSIVSTVKTIKARLNNLENTADDLNTRVAQIENLDVISPLKGKKIAVIGDSISTIYQGNTPSWKIMSIDVGKTIEAWCTYYDINKVIGGKTITSAMVGTKQSFVPTAEDVGKEIGTALSYYNTKSVKGWALQLCELAGCELVCNASWSGSQMVKGQGEEEDGTPKNNEYVASYAWSEYTMSRFANNRDADGNAIVPDVIFIYRGTNDSTHKPHAYVGEWDMRDGIPTTDLLENGHRSFEKAAVILVNKLRTMYPNVYIIFCTLNYFRRAEDLGWTRRFEGGETLGEYNDAIRNVANKLGCGIVEFDKDGISPYVDPIKYYSDGASERPTHPNTLGHSIMARKALSDIKYIFEP